MPFARVSSACTLGVFLVLVVRGPSDWSHLFGVIWWTVVGLAIACAVMGLTVALLAPRQGAKRRLAIAALCFPALLFAAALLQFLIWLSNDPS